MASNINIWRPCIAVPTYALEHKVFVIDAAERWPAADIWCAPGQFAFPVEVPAARVFGREVAGRAGGAARTRITPVPFSPHAVLFLKAIKSSQPNTSRK